MHRRSAALHGTLGLYLRDALQEGSADAVACVPPGCSDFGLWGLNSSLFFPGLLVVSAAFSCKE
jgi:hypothetical protein